MAEKIRTIIFDLGGVVLNRGIRIFMSDLAGKYEISFEDVHPIFLKYYKGYFSGKIREKDFWEKFLGDLDIKAEWKELRERLLNFFKPNDGMLELIKTLRKNGYKLILLSDQTKEWWPYLDSKFAISSYFDYCLISYKVGVSKPDIQVYMTMMGKYKSNPENYKIPKKYKPDTRIYKIALKKYKSKPENSVYIDDLKHNLGPPSDLGIKTIFYENTEQLKKELVRFSVNIK